MEEKRVLFIIRLLVVFFIAALVLSGITAFPIESELHILTRMLDISGDVPNETYSGLYGWLAYVYEGVVNTNRLYPFLAYGSDWLAFAHIMIAVSFIGVYLKPVRNIWIVYFGMISCASVIPLALICGHIRQIPFYWQLIDCSFGVFGIIPLYILLFYIKKLGVIINYKEQEY